MCPSGTNQFACRWFNFVFFFGVWRWRVGNDTGQTFRYYLENECINVKMKCVLLIQTCLISHHPIRDFFLSFVCPSSVSLSFSSSVSLELVLVGLNRGPCRHSCVRLELNKKTRVSSKSVVCMTWKVFFRLIISGWTLQFCLCVACRRPCAAHCCYFVLYSSRVGR